MTELSALDADLVRALNAVLEAGKVPAAGIAVATGDGTYTLIRGDCAADRNDPVSAATAFDIGSCSKSVVSMAVALLVEQGKLRWDDPVQPLLPELTLDDAALTEQVTVRDLLCNRIGLKRQIPLESFADPHITAEQVVRRIAQLDRVYPFREGYVYFNPGFIAARLVVERCSGIAYGDFLHRHLFKPLGMSNSASGGTAVSALVTAEGHAALAGESVPLRGCPRYDNWQGAAGVWMSAADAGRWLQFLLARGAPLVSPTVFDELWRPHTRIPQGECKLIHCPPEADRVDYCLGWWRIGFCGEDVIQHAGEMFGWRAQVALIPARGIGVAVMLNQDTSLHAALAYTVMEKLITGDSRDWVAIAQQDAQRIDASARAAAEAMFPVAADQVSLPLTAYCGTYRHPATGNVVVDLAANEALCARFEDGELWELMLTPLGGDVFRCEFVRAAAKAYMPVPLRLRFERDGEVITGLRDMQNSYRRVT